jgi:hypothetical protein
MNRLAPSRSHRLRGEPVPHHQNRQACDQEKDASEKLYGDQLTPTRQPETCNLLRIETNNKWLHHPSENDIYNRESDHRKHRYVPSQPFGSCLVKITELMHERRMFPRGSEHPVL